MHNLHNQDRRIDRDARSVCLILAASVAGGIVCWVLLFAAFIIGDALLMEPPV